MKQVCTTPTPPNLRMFAWLDVTKNRQRKTKPPLGSLSRAGPQNTWRLIGPQNIISSGDTFCTSAKFQKLNTGCMVRKSLDKASPPPPPPLSFEQNTEMDHRKIRSLILNRPWRILAEHGNSECQFQLLLNLMLKNLTILYNTTNKDNSQGFQRIQRGVICWV